MATTPPTLTPLVGVPSNIPTSKLGTITGVASYDGPYIGGPTGLGLGQVPFKYDTTFGGYVTMDSPAVAFALPVARGDVLGSVAPTGWLLIDLTWQGVDGKYQNDRITLRPQAGPAQVLDLSVSQAPIAYTTPQSLTDLITLMQAVTAAGNTAITNANTATANANVAASMLTAIAGATPYANLAAFPVASGQSGKAAIALDTGGVYRSDGTTWGAPLGYVTPRSLVDALVIQVAALQAGQTAGRIGRQNQAALFAELNWAVNTLAEVTNDPTPANNGVYIKVGASGTGSWLQSSFSRISLLEASVLAASRENLLPANDLRALVADGSQNVAGGYLFLQSGTQTAADYGVLTGAAVPLSFAPRAARMKPPIGARQVGKSPPWTVNAQLTAFARIASANVWIYCSDWTNSGYTIAPQLYDNTNSVAFSAVFTTTDTAITSGWRCYTTKNTAVPANAASLSVYLNANNTNAAGGAVPEWDWVYPAIVLGPEIASQVYPSANRATTTLDGSDLNLPTSRAVETGMALRDTGPSNLHPLDGMRLWTAAAQQGWSISVSVNTSGVPLSGQVVNGTSTLFGRLVPTHRVTVKARDRLLYVGPSVDVSGAVAAGKFISVGVYVKASGAAPATLTISASPNGVVSGANTTLLDTGMVQDGFRLYAATMATAGLNTLKLYLNFDNQASGSDAGTYEMALPTVVIGAAVQAGAYTSDLLLSKIDDLTQYLSIPQNAPSNILSVDAVRTWTTTAQNGWAIGFQTNASAVPLASQVVAGTTTLFGRSIPTHKLTVKKLDRINYLSPIIDVTNLVAAGKALAAGLYVKVTAPAPASVSYVVVLNGNFTTTVALLNTGIVQDGFTFYAASIPTAGLTSVQLYSPVDNKLGAADAGTVEFALATLIVGTGVQPGVYANDLAFTKMDNIASYVPPVSGVRDYNRNPIANSLLDAQVAGTTAPYINYVLNSGGAGGVLAVSSLVDRAHKYGGRMLKITSYYDGTNHSDLQLLANVQKIPDSIKGRAGQVMYTLYHAERTGTGTQFSEYVNFYNAAGGQTFQYGTKVTNPLESNVGSLVTVTHSHAIPVDAVTFSFTPRITGPVSGGNLANEDTYITALMVAYNRVPAEWERNITADIDAEINTFVPSMIATALAAQGGGGGQANDKKNYGSRLRRTLGKLIAQTLSTDASPQSAFDNDVRMVFLGDSVVALDWINNYMVQGVTGQTDGRNFIGLKDRFPRTNFQIVNAGVGGHRADQFKRMLWGSTLPYDPDCVIVSTWGNDGGLNGTTPTEEFISSYEEILITLRRHTTADIIVCNWHLHDAARYSQVENNPMSQALRILADRYDCEFADIARGMYEFGLTTTNPFDADTDAGKAQWSARGYWNTNDVHPVTPGQQLLGSILIKHFPAVGDATNTFDWNGPLNSAYKRVQLIQAEGVVEYEDSRVRVNAEAAWAVSDDTATSSNRVLKTTSTANSAEYVEFVVNGSQIDLIYKQASDGATATVTIDGVAPSTLSRNPVWYPDADDANTYVASAERDAKIKAVLGKWRVSERITLTMTGTAGQLSQTFSANGSVSGNLGNGLSVTADNKLTGANGSYLWIRASDWAGGTTNLYTGDRFYLYAYNAQAINLHFMGDWRNLSFPLIEAADTLDDTFYLRFMVTGAAVSGDYPFRVDRVKRRDLWGEAVADNVITALGTGTTAAAWSSGPFSISAAEMARIRTLLSGSSKWFYYANRKYADTLSCAGSTAYKKVTLASELTNGPHTVRITKSGVGNLYIDAAQVKRPPLE